MCGSGSVVAALSVWEWQCGGSAECARATRHTDKRALLSTIIT